MASSPTRVTSGKRTCRSAPSARGDGALPANRKPVAGLQGRAGVAGSCSTSTTPTWPTAGLTPPARGVPLPCATGDGGPRAGLLPGKVSRRELPTPGDAGRGLPTHRRSLAERRRPPVTMTPPSTTSPTSSGCRTPGTAALGRSSGIDADALFRLTSTASGSTEAPGGRRHPRTTPCRNCWRPIGATWARDRPDRRGRNAAARPRHEGTLILHGVPPVRCEGRQTAPTL